jgi:hypothetical protein
LGGRQSLGVLLEPLDTEKFRANRLFNDRAGKRADGAHQGLNGVSSFRFASTRIVLRIATAHQSCVTFVESRGIVNHALFLIETRGEAKWIDEYLVHRVFLATQQRE